MVCEDECDELIYYKVFKTKGIKKRPKKNIIVNGDVHTGDMSNSYFTRWGEDTPLKRLLRNIERKRS